MCSIKRWIFMFFSVLAAALPLAAAARGHGGSGGGYRGSSGGGYHAPAMREYHPRATYGPAYHPPREPSQHMRQPRVRRWPGQSRRCGGTGAKGAEAVASGWDGARRQGA